jgi:hypothetical protein
MARHDSNTELAIAGMDTLELLARVMASTELATIISQRYAPNPSATNYLDQLWQLSRAGWGRRSAWSG